MVRTHMGSDDANYGCVFQREDETGRVGVHLSKDLMSVAGHALKANITTLGPLVLPISEQLLFFVNLVARKVGLGNLSHRGWLLLSLTEPAVTCWAPSCCHQQAAAVAYLSGHVCWVGLGFACRLAMPPGAALVPAATVSRDHQAAFGARSSAKPCFLTTSLCNAACICLGRGLAMAQQG